MAISFFLCKIRYDYRLIAVMNNLGGFDAHLALHAQVISAANTALLQHLGEACQEEGVLLAKLWNLHTSLITGGVELAQSAARQAEAEAKEMRSQVARCARVNVALCV